MAKEYKYKDLVFTSTKKTLKFHKDNYHFIKSLQESILTDGKMDEGKFWDYIHDPENIKLIIIRFLDGDTDKIVIEVETDEDYQELIGLVIAVLNDFFTNYKPIATPLNS